MEPEVVMIKQWALAKEAEMAQASRNTYNSNPWSWGYADAMREVVKKIKELETRYALMSLTESGYGRTADSAAPRNQVAILI